MGYSNEGQGKLREARQGDVVDDSVAAADVAALEVKVNELLGVLRDAGILASS